jgi:hypothetical protein
MNDMEMEEEKPSALNHLFPGSEVWQIIRSDTQSQRTE